MDSANILKQLITDHPDALSERRVLNALLLDYFPSEKLTRNILLNAYDEEIVNDMRKSKDIDNLTFYRYKSELEQSYGISSALSEEAICIWADALCIGIHKTIKDESNKNENRVAEAKTAIKSEKISNIKQETSTTKKTFYYNTNVFDYEATKKGLRIVRYLGFDDEQEVTIPDSINGEKVVEIGDFAFWKCNWIEKITISEGIKNIGEGAFSECEKLRSISLPGSLENIGLECPTKYSEKITDSKGRRGSFEGSGIKEIVVPNSVLYLCECCFKNCQDLSYVNLSDNLETIESNTFDGCKSLTSVNFPKKLKYINRCAFFFCFGLKKIKFPDELQGIDSKAFAYCSNLTRVYFPDSVSQIAENAFESALNMHPNLIFFCNLGSYAQQYARDHEIRCMKLADYSNMWIH